jgi:hypothetical protein
MYYLTNTLYRVYSYPPGHRWLLDGAPPAGVSKISPAANRPKDACRRLRGARPGNDAAAAKRGHRTGEWQKPLGVAKALSFAMNSWQDTAVCHEQLERKNMHKHALRPDDFH